MTTTRFPLARFIAIPMLTLASVSFSLTLLPISPTNRLPAAAPVVEQSPAAKTNAPR